MNKNSNRICGRKHDHVADATNETLDDQIAEYSGGQHCAHQLADRPEGRLHDHDGRIRPGEQSLKQHQHHTDEDDEAEYGVEQDPIDSLRGGTLAGIRTRLGVE